MRSSNVQGIDYCLAYLSEYLAISSSLDKELFRQVDAKGTSLHDLMQSLASQPVLGSEMPTATASAAGRHGSAIRNTTGPKVRESSDSLKSQTPRLAQRSQNTEINNSRDISTILNSQIEQMEDEALGKRFQFSGGLLLEEALKTTKL